MRHLRRLPRSFIHDGERISYIHVYARSLGPERDAPVEFIAAQETGVEGIACVDDVARFPVYRKVGLHGLRTYATIEVPQKRPTSMLRSPSHGIRTWDRRAHLLASAPFLKGGCGRPESLHHGASKRFGDYTVNLEHTPAPSTTQWTYRWKIR